MLAVAAYSAATEQFVRAAGHAARLLPAGRPRRTRRLRRSLHRSRARCCCAACRSATLPPTPPTPTTPARQGPRQRVHAADRRPPARPAGRLPARARRRPRAEHRAHPGRVPTVRCSTSSKVQLMFHTEAAFHPHRPRYLLLLCLRGDPQRSHDAVVDLRGARRTCRPTSSTCCSSRGSARQSTRATSHGRTNVLGEPDARSSAAIVGRPTMVFDADLMVGIDEQADEAILAPRRSGRAAATPVRARGRRSAGRRQHGRRARSHAVHRTLRRHRPLAAASVRRQRPRTQCSRASRPGHHDSLRRLTQGVPHCRTTMRP